MLIVGILLGLVLGLLAGGRLGNLGTIQLRWIPVLFAAVIIRFGTEAFLNAGVPLADTLRVPLLATSFALLLAGLWVNRGYPGLSLAFVGILLNALVILLNGGYMPIWEPALVADGFAPSEVNSNLRIVVAGDDATDFLLQGLILGDVIPIPIPPLNNVASLGDLFLSLGLGFFLFAGVDGTREWNGEFEEWGGDLVASWQGPRQSTVQLALAPNREHLDGKDYDNLRYSTFFETAVPSLGW